ncbi:NAD-dependent epimerase/dehydratase family protein [Rhizohabitans arisaemae]|uniref:NAD-dependent epimerase/dehydratase family protein n=1 Tax=Rhizohabitans arisaemae TaxID=2720610 RepID=UPI0024B0C7FB|nr:NAD-dependent epimerase/dehydratase family protein [Rhizohabitans arisaemae]
MDILITGASGFIGSALTRVLVARGHRVRGLARSDTAEAKVRSAGAEPVRGSLTDVAVLAREAAAGDGVVHTAATEGEDRPAVDAAAVTSMLAAMTSGVFVTTTGAPRARSSRTPVVEDDTAETTGPLAWLAEAESRVLGATGVRGVVVRPPMVYGDGAGPVAGLVRRARLDGVARYVGSGENRWSTVHVGDLALAYAVLLESEATGVFHVAETAPVPMARLFAAIGDAAGVPACSWSLAEALETHGPLAGFLAMDAALDAGRLRRLGWAPRFGQTLHGICGALRNPAQHYAAAP